MYNYGTIRSARIHHHARPEAGQKQRFAPGEWERVTNRQQRRLVRAYDEWSVKTRKALVKLAQSGGTIQEQNALFDRALRELEIKLSKIYERGTEIAKNMAAGARAELPEIQRIAEQKAREGNEMVAMALIPAISGRIIADISRGMARDPKLLMTSFNATRALPAQYSGGMWVMIFEVQKTLGKKRELERIAEGKTIEKVRWVLDPRAEHCAHSPGFYGCPELAGEYPNWDSLPTVPAGQVTCRGNCRCHLEVFRDGEWRRGVYED